jgi:TIR domain
VTERARRGPLFFMSYAHPPFREHQGSLQQVTEFFHELRELVIEHAGLRAGEDPGFMDTTIAGGRQWNRELRTAVGTCGVFVALLSPHYFASKWCGKEWNAFARRPVVGAATSETAMLPVIWMPWRGAKVPSAIEPVQRFMPDRAGSEIAGRYRQDGVRGMIFMGDSGYQTVLWQLATRIADIVDTHEVGTLILEPDELISAFGETE